MGPTGTASAGSTTTLTTTLTIPVDLTGYTVRITGGTGAGQSAVITNNTRGANAVLTFPALGTGLDNTSTYVILSGRYWFFNAYASVATTVLRYFDRATNTWNTGLTSTTNLPGTWGTDGALVATPGLYGSFGPYTATSGSTSSTVVSGKTWVTNQWTNFQVRFTTGLLAGKSLTITSNTATTLSFATQGSASAASDVFYIEGNDDSLYLFGNNATATYKISISAGTVTTLAVRTAAMAAGGIACWVSNVNDSRWTAENYSSTNGYQNARFIYTFTGGATSTIYQYDIVGNTWALITPWGFNETLTTGSYGSYDNGNYIYFSKDATGRKFRFNLSSNIIQPWSTILYADGTAVVGQKMWPYRITDGAVSLTWIYRMRQTGSEVFRMLEI
jgi:hypothetical protein